MQTGKLTPRSAETVAEMRFTGGFGQPDGFASILSVNVRTSGEAYLTLDYRLDPKGDEHRWSVGLTSEQRRALGRLLLSYEPVLIEQTIPVPAPEIRGGSGGACTVTLPSTETLRAGDSVTIPIGADVGGGFRMYGRTNPPPAKNG